LSVIIDEILFIREYVGHIDLSKLI
jgi:hypothetical protein